jgi:hypothetical protein
MVTPLAVYRLLLKLLLLLLCMLEGSTASASLCNNLILLGAVCACLSLYDSVAQDVDTQ